MTYAEAEPRSEQVVAGEIFDKYVDARIENRQGEVRIFQIRAIAAASILSNIEGNIEWYRVMDEQLAGRGINSHYSDLDARRRRGLLTVSMYEAGLITARCRTLRQGLEALNTVEQD